MSAAPVLDLVQTVTLREAILSEYALGAVDPRDVAKAILTKYDETWLATVLLEEAEEILAEKARDLAGAARRAHLRLVPGEKRTDKYGATGFLETTVYVEGIGWKTHSNLTADECEIVAGDYDRKAVELKAVGNRYRKFATLIREQNVKTLGKAKGVEVFLG